MRHVTATTSRKKPLKGTRSPSTVKSLDVSSSEENKSNDEKNTAFMVSVRLTKSHDFPPVISYSIRWNL